MRFTLLMAAVASITLAPVAEAATHKSSSSSSRVESNVQKMASGGLCPLLASGQHNQKAPEEVQRDIANWMGGKAAPVKKQRRGSKEAT